MAEEGKFSKHPRIAWGPPSRSKSAEDVSKAKVHPCRSGYPDIYTNYIEPSKAKLLVGSSLSKLNLTPGLPYLPEQSKFFHFGRHKPSQVTGALSPLLSSTRPLTQSSRQTSLSFVSVSGENTIKEHTTILGNRSTKRKTEITNLAQVVPVNCTHSMEDRKKELNTVQDSTDKKLHPRKPCQCTSTVTCVYHSDITEENIDRNSARTTSKLINVLPANTSDSANIKEANLSVEEKPHLEQTSQHTLGVEADCGKERDKMSKHSVWIPIKLVNTAPTDATKTVESQKEKSKLETPVNVKPRLSRHIVKYTPAADASCDIYHLPVVYSKKYNIDITKLYQMPTKKKAQPPPQQPFLLDKPAKVLSAIKDKLLYQPIEAIDASSVYNLFNFVCDPIRRCQVDKIVELMNLAPLKLPKPITWKQFFNCMLHPLLIQMMGSVLTCKLAIDEGWAINIGGGFSHYTTNEGGGLAVYDDVLVCLALVSEFPDVKHILVVNLDAYQVTVIDFYSQPIEENHGYSKTVNQDIKYMGYMVNKGEETSSEYLSRFKQVVKEYLDSASIQPSLCIYVAGTTILADNPHTVMKFSNEGIVKRDHTLFQVMKHYNIPTAFLMGGGYQPYDVRATSSSIINLLENNILTKTTLGGKS